MKSSHNNPIALFKISIPIHFTIKGTKSVISLFIFLKNILSNRLTFYVIKPVNFRAKVQIFDRSLSHLMRKKLRRKLLRQILQPETEIIAARFKNRGKFSVDFFFSFNQ